MSSTVGGSSVRARPAGEKDIDDLCLLYEDWIAEQAGYRGDWERYYGLGPDHRLRLAEMIQLDEFAVFVVEHDGRVVGGALARIVPVAGCPASLVCRLDWLFVVSFLRQRGLGRSLLQAAEVWGRDAGCTGIDFAALPGHRGAKSFGEHLGMKARSLTMSKEWE